MTAPVYHDFPAPNADDLVGLRYFSPPDALRSYISTIYLFTANAASVSDTTRADFAQLRFMLSGTGYYSFIDDRAMETPQVCMLGPTMGATRFDVQGPLQTVGIGLLPLGWCALTGLNASDFADSLYDMAAVQGPDYAEMLAVLQSTPDPDVGIAALCHFLETRIAPVSASIVSFIAAVDGWLADEQSPRVEVLQEATGLSARQVARLTNRLYGAPPKYLARKYRALRCASLIADGTHEWTEFIEDTFYDQSHFIREIKHFVGLTPHQLVMHPTVVARLTLDRRVDKGVVAPLSRIS